MKDPNIKHQWLIWPNIYLITDWYLLFAPSLSWYLLELQYFAVTLEVETVRGWRSLSPGRAAEWMSRTLRAEPGSGVGNQQIKEAAIFRNTNLKYDHLLTSTSLASSTETCPPLLFPSVHHLLKIDLQSTFCWRHQEYFAMYYLSVSLFEKTKLLKWAWQLH